MLIAEAADVYDCPNGTVVASFHAGDRVIPVARDADSAFLAVPGEDGGEPLWLDRDAVKVDDAVVAELPVIGCVAVASPAPTVTVAPTVEPVQTQAPVPAPAADTVGPTLSAASVNPNEVFAADSYADYCAIVATISVAATDNVGVAGVTISWSGPESGTAEMTFGTGWSYGFNPAQTTPRGTVTFTMVARDAAGNTSAPVTTTVLVWNSGDCII
jgi:hypothetical protein